MTVTSQKYTVHDSQTSKPSKSKKQSSSNNFSSMSRRFKMAFDKSLDKLFPENDRNNNNEPYLHPLGMQPFMSTSCHVTMVGAGAHPKNIASKKYWRSFPEMASSSNTLNSVDSSSDSLTKT